MAEVNLALRKENISWNILGSLKMLKRQLWRDLQTDPPNMTQH